MPTGAAVWMVRGSVLVYTAGTQLRRTCLQSASVSHPGTTSKSRYPGVPSASDSGSAGMISPGASPAISPIWAEAGTGAGTIWLGKRLPAARHSIVAGSKAPGTPSGGTTAAPSLPHPNPTSGSPKDDSPPLSLLLLKIAVCLPREAASVACLAHAAASCG